MGFSDVLSIGIALMLFAFFGISIGKILVFLPISWWLYFFFISKKPEFKKSTFRIAIGVMLLLTIIEAYLIWYGPRWPLFH